MLKSINIPIQTINWEFLYSLNKSNTIIIPIFLYYEQTKLNVIIIRKLCKNNDTFFAWY